MYKTLLRQRFSPRPALQNTFLCLIIGFYHCPSSSYDNFFPFQLFADEGNTFQSFFSMQFEDTLKVNMFRYGFIISYGQIYSCLKQTVFRMYYLDNLIDNTKTVAQHLEKNHLCHCIMFKLVMKQNKNCQNDHFRISTKFISSQNFRYK